MSVFIFVNPFTRPVVLQKISSFRLSHLFFKPGVSFFNAFLFSVCDLISLLSETDFHATFLTWAPLANGWEKVGDIVPWMTVKTGAQSLLVKEVSNQTDGTTEDEKTVEDTHLKVVFGFFRREGTAVTEEINEADSDTTIDVENQVVFL